MPSWPMRGSATAPGQPVALGRAHLQLRVLAVGVEQAGDSRLGIVIDSVREGAPRVEWTTMSTTGVGEAPYIGGVGALR